MTYAAHHPGLGPYTAENPRTCRRCGILLPDITAIAQRCEGEVVVSEGKSAPEFRAALEEFLSYWPYVADRDIAAELLRATAHLLNGAGVRNLRAVEEGTDTVHALVRWDTMVVHVGILRE